MSRIAARLVAVLAPAALLAPVTAHAEKVVTEDQAGDVLVLNLTDDGGEETAPAPEYSGIDILRTVVAHGNRRLRVTVRFGALDRDPFQFTVVRIATRTGTYDVVVERLGGRPITSIDRGEEAVDCDGLKAKVDLGADTVTMSLPTHCIGGPRWVRVGVGAIAVAADQTDPELAAAYADDAHRAGEVRDNIATGPKVRRG